MPSLRYTEAGYIVIMPGDDPAWIVDAMLATNYAEEFCLSPSFDPLFMAELMAAGFLIMSVKMAGDDPAAEEDRYLLLPKLHLKRSLLFFEDLRETKTARRLLKRYELRFDAAPEGMRLGWRSPQPGGTDHSAFERILERCAQVHGDDWLTVPLRQSLKAIRRYALSPYTRKGRLAPVLPVSFGLYREGELVAGEFGVAAGRVYTSYSGYRDEDSSGTVQLILTARFLRDLGFDFWDLGMPLDYKDRLGAVNVYPPEFVALYRKALKV